MLAAGRHLGDARLRSSKISVKRAPRPEVLLKCPSSDSEGSHCVNSTRTAEMTPDLDLWRLCAVMNVIFSHRLIKPLRCIVCAKTSEPAVNAAVPATHSRFWCDAVRCAAGHRQDNEQQQPSNGETARIIGVCSACEHGFVVEILKGRRKCAIEGCRRTLVVDVEAATAQFARHGVPK